jgi:hypothetical protein
MAKREIKKTQIRSIPADLSLPDFLENYQQFFPIPNEGKRVEAMTKEYETLTAARQKADEKREAQISVADEHAEEFKRHSRKKSS